MSEPMKTCTKCGEAKPATTQFFGPSPRCKQGTRGQCRACCNAAQRKRNAFISAEDKRMQSAAWRKANPERSREIKSRWRNENRERKNEMERSRRAANIEHERARARDYARRYRAEHPEKSRLSTRASHMKAKYGISIEMYEAMYRAQGGICACCGRVPTTRHPLVIDHAHDTGVVRGLLCRWCNIALGHLGDTEDGVARAVDYLRKAAGQPSNVIVMKRS